MESVKRKNDDEDPVNGVKRKKISDENGKIPDVQANENGAEGSVCENPNTARVKWTTLGKTILRSQESKELTLKKFQKKIIAEYLARMGNPPADMTVETLWAKCLNKLGKNPKFKIQKERIRIVS